MAVPKRLKKNIGFFGVFAIATGTTISGGFFLLPGLAAVEAGSSIVLAYLIAIIPLVPALLSQIELATALPRSGGFYFFIDRTLGPYFGTVGGIGTWLALILKVAFALVGIGAYLKIFFPTLEIIPIAITIALILGAINYFGAKKSGTFQIILFFCLAGILLYYIILGSTEIKYEYIHNMFDVEILPLFSTAGFVFMSYIGITKVIRLAEEIIKPEQNLPKGIFLALAVTILIYSAGLLIMVGVVPMEQFAGSLIPVAIAAEVFAGKFGIILISIAALLSFISVANAGILTASRYPLAMSRDHLLPLYFRKINQKGTPYISLLVTVAAIVLLLITVNPSMIAKLTSTFLLIIFSVLNLSVIVMRESKIESYDPGFKSPFYPWTQIFGIAISNLFIFDMGLLPLLFSLLLTLLGTLWYKYYVQGKVLRTGAIYNLFERLGKYKYAGVDYELRDLMKKRKPKKEDPFDELIAKSMVIDLDQIAQFDDIVSQVSDWISKDLHYTSDIIKKEFMDGTRLGTTPVIEQIALPHLILDELKEPKLVLVRSKKGVKILLEDFEAGKDQKYEVTVKAVFFLVSPKHNPTQHLRILARIASRVEEKTFFRDWNEAQNDHEIKIAMLNYERFLFIKIRTKDDTVDMIGQKLKDVWLGDECLVAWIRRKNTIVFPDGETNLLENDILTIIGEPENLDEIVKHFHLIRANYIE